MQDPLRAHIVEWMAAGIDSVDDLEVAAIADTIREALKDAAFREWRIKKYGPVLWIGNCSYSIEEDGSLVFTGRLL